nr:DNA translocase FtsK 4TM domain-containing protein [Rubritepida sp.]
MARDAVTAAPRAGTPPGGRFASAAVRAAIARRLNEFGALLLGLLGLALLLAVGSYNPGDPSLSTATAAAPANLLGRPGALVADVLRQAIGWAAFLPPAVLLAWALRMAGQRGVSLLPLRVLALLGALGLGAALLARVPGAEPGAAGPLLGDALRALLDGLFGELGDALTLAILAVPLAGLLYLAFGLSFGEWGRAARVTAETAARGAETAARLGSEHRHVLLRPVLTPLSRLRRAFTRRRSEPGEDLASLLRAAERAAEAPPARREPRVAPGAPAPVPAPAAVPEPAGRAPRVAAPPKPRTAPVQGALDLPVAGWRTPPLELLAPPPARPVAGPSAEALQANARMLEQVLNDYGVNGAITEIRPGPVVTLYELEPAPGTKSSRVIGLADDIARSMSVVAVRIATVPGRNVIGIELPNVKRETVFLSEMLASDEYARGGGRLPLVLGKDIGGAPVVADLARAPHLLIAGTTGSGKSVGINTMILSLLYRFSPAECRFIMIDPKMLELSVYDRIPHLL